MEAQLLFQRNKLFANYKALETSLEDVVLEVSKIKDPIYRASNPVTLPKFA